MTVIKPVKGGDRLQEYLNKILKGTTNPGTLRVGFLENATYPDGTSVAEIAAINNFGAPNAGIPARPFFSNMVNREAGGWGVKLERLLRLNDYDGRKALQLMGAGIEGQLRQAIVDTMTPANSPVTDLLKQRFPQGGQTFEDVLQARADVEAGVTAPAGKPLVQSGHMLQSVDSEVTNG